MMDFLPYKNIREYQEELVSLPNGCVQAVKYYLKEIEVKKSLNAFVEVYEGESLQRAELLDRKRASGEKMGLLHGVVIALKDVICHSQHTLTAASAIIEGFTSLFSSTAVKRLLDEDAIIIGNCNCDEFAMGSTNENSIYGNVLNALDETKVPGGSSGGSAVAVQAGLCMVSLGSDTGGSVRQPADFCGIIGLKPSYGRISRYGLIAYASSFDQIGIFGNSIDDVRLILEIISGPDEFDSTVSNKTFSIDSRNSKSKNKKYKIACIQNALDHPSIDQEIKNSITRLGNKLADSGHTIGMIDFDLLDYIVPAYYVLTTAEASSNLSRYDGIRYGKALGSGHSELTKFYTTNRSNGFGNEVKRRIMLGTFVLSAGYYDAYYSKAQQIRQLLVNKTSAIFEDYDMILMPTVPSTAFGIGEMTKDPIKMYLADIYTVYANLTGIPAISLPLFKHSNGMPFGAQIMTSRYNEVTLLDVSEMLLSDYKEY